MPTSTTYVFGNKRSPNGISFNNNNRGYERGFLDRISSEEKSTPLLEDDYDEPEEERNHSSFDVGDEDEEDNSDDPPITRKVLLELTLCVLSFVGRGLCLNSVGPTLLDLRQLTRSSIEASGLIFVSQSIGYLVGSIAAKPLFEKFNSRFLMALNLLLQALSTALIPTSRFLSLLCIGFIFQGFALAVVAIGVCSICIRLGGKLKSGMFLQVAYVGVSIGSILAPVIAKPFLSQVAAHSDETSSITDFIVNSQTQARGVTVKHDQPALTTSTASSNQGNDHPDPNGGLLDNATATVVNATGAMVTGGWTGAETFSTTSASVTTSSPLSSQSPSHIYSTDTYIQMDYIIMGLILCVPAAGFMYLFCRRDQYKEVTSGSKGKGDNESESVPISIRTMTKPLAAVLALVGVNTMFYFGMQDAYSNLLTTFAVTCDLHLSKSTGVYLSSLFWLSIFVGRLAGIGVARFLSPFRMMMLDLVGACVAAAILVFFAQSSETVVWTATALLGLSFASYNGCTVAWAAKHVDGKETVLSLIMVGRCAGLLTIPTLTAVAFGATGAMALMYALGLVCVVLAVTLPLMQALVRRHGGRDSKMRAERAMSHADYQREEAMKSPRSSPSRHGSRSQSPRTAERAKLSASGELRHSDYGYDQ